MVLRASTQSPRTISLAERLYIRLSAPGKGALSKLLYCMPPPIDGCRVGSVVAGAAASIAAYGATLIQPSGAFLEIANQVQALAAETSDIVDRGDWPPELADPVFRSFRLVPAWALMPRLLAGDLPDGAITTVGAELAFSLAIRKPFKKSFAEHLVEALTDKPKLCNDGTPVWRRKSIKALVAANSIFEIGRSTEQEAAFVDGFALALTRLFRTRIALASEKDHQAVLNHRTQSVQQMRESATWLRQQVEAGDEAAMQMMLGILGFIPMPLVLDLPIVGPWSGDYPMALDFDDGCLKTSMGLFVTGGAKPRAASGATIVPAGDVIVKPTPRFLLAALAAKREATPQARTCGSLLPGAAARSHDMTRANGGNDLPRLKASVARFSNGFGKFAIGVGIDRYLAALVTNDPRIVPTGKFYYAQASREEIWSATQTLYDALGWGETVDMVGGLAVGSQVTPAEPTVARWAEWMRREVEDLAPGRRYTFKSLSLHHNAFAQASASLATFLLALRERKPVHLLASDCVSERVSVSVDDKRCGLIKAAHKVPLHGLLVEQVTLWLAHCRCIDDRLAKLGIDVSSPLRQRLRDILAGKKVPMFFTINWRKGVHSISSDDLAKWWPQDLGLDANFARHFWQPTLRRAGVSSSDIDVYERHHLRGTDARSSTSNKVAANVRQHILAAMDIVVRRLQIQAIPGLAGRA